MATKVRYIKKENVIVVSSVDHLIMLQSNDLGEEVENLADLINFPIEKVLLYKIKTSWLLQNKDYFSGIQLTSLCVRDCCLDFDNIVWNCNHLIIDGKGKLNISSKNFNGLSEITFLNVLEFRGSFEGPFFGLIKAVLWKGDEKTNDIIIQLPDLRELSMFQGSINELRIQKNTALISVDLHRCTKLTNIHFNPNHKLPLLTLESCNKLPDLSDFVASYHCFPPFKSN